ncbi:TPA: hypothetical protein TZW92_001818 [Streptococcus suis]|nr:hypothetical protein [Streptococcus suis]
MTKTFFKKVDKRSKQGMIDFLNEHLTYDTMNSWNRSTSYANNVKIYNLGLDEDIEDKLYKYVDEEVEIYELDYILREMKESFAREWGYYPGFNGRSGGYIVLYNTCLVDGKRETYPGRPFPTVLDDNYEDIILSELREEVELVQAFDKWVDELLQKIVDYLSTIEIIEETYTIERTRLIAV